MGGSNYEKSAQLGGTTTKGAKDGQTIVQDWGRDNSAFGDKSKSRNGATNFSGGMDDLSHSLKGASANQSGK